jgi:Protein-L-isoaspartate(D-aspartate) O-methyltransferase (PCMT)
MEHTVMFYKVRDVFRAEGVSGLARRSIAYAYRRGVRPCIPFGKAIHFAGIPTCYDSKWGDGIVPASWLPLETVDQPGYEATLIAGLKETIRPGDSVVVVGGGVGVTAVVAALQTGSSGTVRCFEASKQYVGLIQQTVARNKITNVSVHHAVVAKPIFVYSGEMGPILAPSQLPSCDVLELDCEGAEVEILREMIIHPRVVLVETHGVLGAPTNLTASLLEKRGYVVSDRGVAEPRDIDYFTKTDIRVLLGINSSILERAPPPLRGSESLKKS